MTGTISREALKDKLDRRDRFVLIEAQQPGAYEALHLPGAINLPFEQMAEVPTLLPDKNAEIVLYCSGPT